MTVFLVPMGSARYQLYVEIPPDADVEGSPAEPHHQGWFGRQVQRFKAMMAEAEQERLRRERGDEDRDGGLGRRAWRFVLRKIAEFVAEQRLLWHLRHQNAAEVQHPDRMSRQDALAEVRAEFTRDVSRHRRWTIIDGSIAAVTGPLFFLVPGPNILSWYFTFRAIGHLFAWRGAQKGLTSVAWSTRPSPPLSEIDSALGLPTHDRRLRLLEIGETLGLQHLAAFVERARRG
jgi:hypothetical protein